MAIYVFNAPDNPQDRQFVYDSLVNGKISRFLWSNFDNCDLNRIAQIPDAQRTADEQTVWNQCKRLLDFVPNDWVLHKNIPTNGQVVAARLLSRYFYQPHPPKDWNDGRHCFQIDEYFVFDINDPAVPANLSRSIKSPGGLFQSDYADEFDDLLDDLRKRF